MNGNICCHTMENRCPPKDEPKEYHVRKDNTVRYRTNYYSVPSSTYRNRNTVVWLLENNGYIELYDKESGKLICRHELCPGKGKMYVTKDIIRTRHGV